MYTIYVTLLVFNLKSSRELKTYGVGCTREVAVGLAVGCGHWIEAAIFCTSSYILPK